MTSRFRLESTIEQVNALGEVWHRARSVLTGAEHRKIDSTQDRAVERHKALDDHHDQFKRHLASCRIVYAFLAQIIPFLDNGPP